MKSVNTHHQRNRWYTLIRNTKALNYHTSTPKSACSIFLKSFILLKRQYISTFNWKCVTMTSQYWKLVIDGRRMVLQGWADGFPTPDPIYVNYQFKNRAKYSLIFFHKTRTNSTCKQLIVVLYQVPFTTDSSETEGRKPESIKNRTK